MVAAIFIEFPELNYADFIRYLKQIESYSIYLSLEMHFP